MERVNVTSNLKGLIFEALGGFEDKDTNLRKTDKVLAVIRARLEASGEEIYVNGSGELAFKNWGKGLQRSDKS